MKHHHPHRSVSRRLALCAASAAILGLSAGTADAQAPTFPSKMIKIVPFGSAGSPLDVISRIYADKLQQRFGQTVIVEAKPGASGILAADAVAKAPPDGHTIMITLPLTHVNNAILMAKLPYDPVKDFEPLTQLATGGPVMVARANAPYATLPEFVAFAKKQTVPLTYGTWGTGSTAHLYGETLKRQAGLQLTHVAYKAEAAAHNDLFGGGLDFAWANPATARNLLQAGRIKVIGLAAQRRNPALPQVPTFGEQGYAGFDTDSWIGAYAPAKTPKATLELWTEALREITRMPDVQEKLVTYGFQPLGNSTAEFVANYQKDYPRIAEMIKSAGVTVD